MASSLVWRPRNIDPGAAAYAGSTHGMTEQPAVVRAAAPIKLRPDPGAPDIAQLQPREQVTVSAGRNGYALVQTSSGQQGYVSASDLQGTGGRRSISVPTTAPVAAAERYAHVGGQQRGAARRLRAERRGDREGAGDRLRADAV